MTPIGPEVAAALAPDPGDGRLVRLGKLAALALIGAGVPVTRASLAARSREVDDDETRRKRGFSESSLATNVGLRRIYELARHEAPRTRLRRRGRVAAHIMRLTKAALASALVVARMAAAEREEEFRLATLRLGGPWDTAAIDGLRDTRAALAANRIAAAGCATDGVAALRAAAGGETALALARARERAGKQGIRATAVMLAERTGLHPGTVERIAAAAAHAARDAASYGFEVAPPPALLRLAKWDLGRALHVERAYIRKLHGATMAIAAIVIEREHRERRARPAPAP